MYRPANLTLSTYFIALIVVLIPTCVLAEDHTCKNVNVGPSKFRGFGITLGSQLSEVRDRFKLVARDVPRGLGDGHVNVYEIDDPLQRDLIGTQIETVNCPDTGEVVVGVRGGKYSTFSPVSAETWLNSEKERLNKAAIGKVDISRSSDIVDIWGLKEAYNPGHQARDLSILGGTCRLVAKTTQDTCGMARWIVYIARVIDPTKPDIR